MYITVDSTVICRVWVALPTKQKGNISIIAGQLTRRDSKCLSAFNLLPRQEHTRLSVLHVMCMLLYGIIAYIQQVSQIDDESNHIVAQL